MTALKFDSGKPPMSLLPGRALQEIALAFEFGRRKYSKENWRLGFEWSRLLDACLRHLTSWADGERIDQESGLSHLAHAGAMLLMLIWHELTGTGKDDVWLPPTD